MKRLFNAATLCSMLLLAASCGEKLGGEENAPTVNKSVTFTPERDKLLKNPFSGWAIYAGLGSGISDNFWEIYDNFPSSEGNIKVSDYASLLLIRIKWSEIEPTEGLYAWDSANTTAEAKRYRMLVEGAKERNLRVVLSLRMDSRDLDVWAVPKFVQDKGAKGFTSGSKSVWTPYPDDPVFQREYKKFLQALATQFNNPDVGAYVQGVGIGKWGEYHTCIYSTNDESPREAVLDWVCDTFMEVFDQIPVVINYHRLIGTAKDSGGADPQSERLLAKAYNKGLCFGSGAFGMKSYYSKWERDFIAQYKYKVPVTMEGGWVRGSHSMAAINADGYATWADVRQGEYDEARGAFVNVMDLRYNSNISISETWSWFNEAFSLVKGFIKEGVYRIYPNKISYPESLAEGASFTISSRWCNLGWSYCPTNVVQYEQRYKVAYALLDSRDEVAAIFFDEAEKPSDWIKETPVSYNFSDKLPGGIKGDYTWAVAIVDVKKGNVPGIQLSVKDNVKTADGWVKIGNVTIK